MSAATQPQRAGLVPTWLRKNGLQQIRDFEKRPGIVVCSPPHQFDFQNVGPQTSAPEMVTWLAPGSSWIVAKKLQCHQAPMKLTIDLDLEYRTEMIDRQHPAPNTTARQTATATPGRAKVGERGTLCFRRAAGGHGNARATGARLADRNRQPRYSAGATVTLGMARTGIGAITGTNGEMRHRSGPQLTGEIDRFDIEVVNGLPQTTLVGDRNQQATPPPATRVDWTMALAGARFRLTGTAISH